MDFPDPKYRSICSQATLHTKDGFFPDLLSKVTEEVGFKWIDGVFAKQTLDKDKIKACCADKKVWGIIYGVLQNIQQLYRKKSAKAARDARLEGDKAIKDGSFKKAVMLYCQSVIKAPKLNEDPTIDDGMSLAFALRSRAQAHFVLHRFKACLADLHLSLEEGYPEPLRYQIYRTMGDAYMDLNETKRANISWQIALKLLEEQILLVETTDVRGSKKTKDKDGKLKQTLEKERIELKKVLNAKPKCGFAIGEPLPSQTTVPLTEITGTRHEKYTNASSLVSIRRTLEEGRFAVAGADIPTGTTLVIEEPHASVLIVEKFGSHCHHCFTRLHSPVPCFTCAGLAFCSTNCRTAAESYHRYECQYQGIFQGAGLSALSYLALRLITQEGFQFFKGLQSKIEALKKGKDEKLSDQETKYTHIHNLTSHSGLRSNDDYFHRAVMALFLVQCLRGTDFFGSSSSKSNGSLLSEDEMLTASLILHHLQVLQFNAHELYETSLQAKGQTKGAKSIYVAVGIYPTVALFNHECAPAVTRYFHGKHIILRSVRPLKKGETISENYGPIYIKRTLLSRTRDLTSRYWFKCDCLPCKENWPTLEEITDQHQRLRCPTPQCRTLFPIPTSTKKSETNPRCPSCFNNANLNEVLKQFQHYHTLYERGIGYVQDNRTEMAEQLLTTFLDQIYTVGPPPSKEIALAQEALRTCYAQTGNIWIVDS